MDLSLQIIHHAEFLRTTPRGEIDLEASKQLFLRLASINRPPDGHDVLVDMRGTTSRATVAEIIQVVALMLDHREAFRHKLAILTLPGPRLESARFMALYARNRGLSVEAFDSFEEALLWLSTITEVSADGD